MLGGFIQGCNQAVRSIHDVEHHIHLLLAGDQNSGPVAINVTRLSRLMCNLWHRATTKYERRPTCLSAEHAIDGRRGSIHLTVVRSMQRAQGEGELAIGEFDGVE